MLREAISIAESTSYQRYDVEANRVNLVRANEFSVFIKGIERFRFTGGKGKFWRRAERRFGIDAETYGEWEKPTKSYQTVHFNGAEIIDMMIDKGWEVSHVEVIK